MARLGFRAAGIALVVLAAVVLAAVVVALVVVAGVRHLERSPAQARQGSGATGSAADQIAHLLARARVLPGARPDVPGYDRDCGPGDGCVFGTSWTDDSSAPDSHNGCDTRNDVLGESLHPVEFEPRSHGCKVVGGILAEPYTGRREDFAAPDEDIQIDHVFPLKAAWDLGASTWTLAERTAFANDTDLELLAVDGSQNESKGDDTLGEWLPPNAAYRCEYAVRYLGVADAYDLALTAPDVSTAHRLAASCG